MRAVHVGLHRLLIRHTKAAVTRDLLCVLPLSTNQKHTQREEVASKYETMLCPCCPLTLVYFYFSVSPHIAV